MTRGIIFFSVLALCLLGESRIPLRNTVQNKLRRVIINLSFGALGFSVLWIVFVPWLIALSNYVHENNFGLVYSFTTHPIAQRVIAFLLLDYTLYFWHWLNHRLPILWRFHVVHHVDRDLDVSTASRFHVGELVLSVGYRSAQIVVIGVDPLTLVIFEAAVTTAAQFHHSNIKLPIALERILCWLIVTPRMHGIHHSIVAHEVNSNFSTIFSFWDRIHRSLRLNVSNQSLTIGVSGLLDSQHTRFLTSLLLPIKRTKPPKWKYSRVKNNSQPTNMIE